MNKNQKFLLIFGLILLIPMYVASRNVTSIQKAYDNWKLDRKSKKYFAKMREEAIAYYKNQIANSPDPNVRKFAEIELRYMIDSEKLKTFRDFINPTDGIDSYEAYVIAARYFSSNFGACGSVGLPEKEGTNWIVPIGIGRKSDPNSPPDLPIIIDADTGLVSYGDGRKPTKYESLGF